MLADSGGQHDGGGFVADTPVEIAANQPEPDPAAPRPPTQGQLPVHVHVYFQLSITRTLIPNATDTFIQNGYTCSNGHFRATRLIQIAVAHPFHSLKLPSTSNGQLPRNSAGGPTDVSPRPAIHTGHGTGGQSSRSLKRKYGGALRQNDDDDDANEEDDERQPTDLNNKPDAGQDSPEARLFACPFHKLNPRKYWRCANLRLKSFDRVNQHIKRKHLKPGSPCDICWRPFRDGQALSDHSRTQECAPARGPDELFEEDLPLLETGRGLNPVGKWYQLWDQLFAGHPRPHSAYIEQGIDEFGGLFTNECESRSQALLPDIQARFTHVASPNNIAEIVTALMEGILSEPLLGEDRPRRLANARPPTTQEVPIAEDPPIDNMVPGDDRGRQDAVLCTQAQAAHSTSITDLPVESTNNRLDDSEYFDFDRYLEDRLGDSSQDSR